MNSPGHIVIMGTPVAPGNRGVMALGASLVDLCHHAAPSARISFLQVHTPWEDVVVETADGPYAVPVVTCRISPRALLRDHLGWIVLLSLLYRLIPFLRPSIVQYSPWVQVVSECDFVGDVRGGDSFSDIYGLNRFLIATLPVLSVLLIKKSIVHFPQTYGPFKSRLARWIAHQLLTRSTRIVARDTDSQAVANELVGGKPSVELSPDVAFALHAIRPDPISTEPAGSPVDGKGVIGLNINALMYNGGYSRKNMFDLRLDYRAFVPELISALLKESNAELLLVPHTFAIPGDIESDNDVCRIVREALSEKERDRVRIVAKEYDQHEIKGVIGKCDFFVGSRMHSCIAALSQGVPCVGVAYSRKFDGVFKSVGMQEWVVDGRQSDATDAIDVILDRYRSRDSVRATLMDQAEGARCRLRELFVSIVRSEISRNTSGVPDTASKEALNRTSF